MSFEVSDDLYLLSMNSSSVLITSGFDFVSSLSVKNQPLNKSVAMTTKVTYSQDHPEEAGFTEGSDVVGTIWKTFYRICCAVRGRYQVVSNCTS